MCEMHAPELEIIIRYDCFNSPSLPPLRARAGLEFVERKPSESYGMHISLSLLIPLGVMIIFIELSWLLARVSHAMHRSSTTFSVC